MKYLFQRNIQHYSQVIKHPQDYKNGMFTYTTGMYCKYNNLRITHKLSTFIVHFT